VAEEQVVLTAEQARDLAARSKLLDQMWKHPKGREYLQEGMHVTFPDAEVPGYETRKVKDEVIAEAVKIREDTKKVVDDWRAEQALTGIHARLRADGFNASDIAAIEKMMVEEGFGTHAAAAESYRVRQQIASPRSPSPSKMHLPGRSQTQQWSKWFNGIGDGDGEDWLHERIDMIRTDFARDPKGAEKRWLDENYWPDPAQVTA